MHCQDICIILRNFKKKSLIFQYRKVIYFVINAYQQHATKNMILFDKTVLSRTLLNEKKISTVLDIL